MVGAVHLVSTVNNRCCLLVRYIRVNNLVLYGHGGLELGSLYQSTLYQGTTVFTYSVEFVIKKSLKSLSIFFAMTHRMINRNVFIYNKKKYNNKFIRNLVSTLLLGTRSDRHAFPPD